MIPFSDFINLLKTSLLEGPFNLPLRDLSVMLGHGYITNKDLNKFIEMARAYDIIVIDHGGGDCASVGIYPLATFDALRTIALKEKA